MPKTRPTIAAAALGIVRDMRWLDGERARAYGVILAIAWSSFLGGVIYMLNDGLDRQGHLFGGDYSSFWAASRLVLAGMSSDVYLPPVHYLAELPARSADFEAFYYPPTYLLLCAPLALLSFTPSLLLFEAVTGGAFLLTIHAVLRRWWSVIAALASPLVAMNIIAGQNAFLTTAILGTGLTLLDRRPRFAGMVLGLMVIKPHLALFVPVALIISRRWTALFSAGAVALGLIFLTFFLFGWQVWAAFLGHLHDARDTLVNGGVGFTKMQSAFVLFRFLGFGEAVADTVQAGVAGLCLATLLWARQQRFPATTERSLIVLACLLTTPFLLHYDMLISTLPLAWMLRSWIDNGFPPWSKLVMILALCAPALYVIGGGVVFGAPVLLFFGAFLVWSGSNCRTRKSSRARVVAG